MFRAMLKILMGKEVKNGSYDVLSLSVRIWRSMQINIKRLVRKVCVWECVCVYVNVYKCILDIFEVSWVCFSTMFITVSISVIHDTWIFKITNKKRFPIFKTCSVWSFSLKCAVVLNVFLSSKVVTPVFRNNLLLSVFSLYIICQYVLPGNWTHNLLRC